MGRLYNYHVILGLRQLLQSVLNGMKKIKTNPAFLLSLDLKNM